MQTCCDDLRTALRSNFIVEDNVGFSFRAGGGLISLPHCPWCTAKLSSFPSPIVRHQEGNAEKRHQEGNAEK